MPVALQFLCCNIFRHMNIDSQTQTKLQQIFNLLIDTIKFLDLHVGALTSTLMPFSPFPSFVSGKSVLSPFGFCGRSLLTFMTSKLPNDRVTKQLISENVSAFGFLCRINFFQFNFLFLKSNQIAKLKSLLDYRNITLISIQYFSTASGAVFTTVTSQL